MSSVARDTFALLRYYTLRHKSPVIEFDAFLSFVERYIARYRQERPSLEELATDTRATLIEQFMELSESGACVVESVDGMLRRLTFPQYFIDAVHESFKKLDEAPETPFPSRDALGKIVPEEMFRTIEIGTGFMELLEDPEQFRFRIIRLVFPDQIREMIVTLDLVQKRLIEYCIAKIRQYLNTQRNADYVRQKLLAVFQNRDLILKDTLDSIVQKPALATANFINPSEFTYSFWAHLSNFIIQEYRLKESKLTEEHGFCQAAHLLGFYNAFFKGKVQKEKEEENALKALLSGLRNPPYLYTVTDIINMKDRNGLRIARRVTSERLHAFIEGRLVPEKDRALPEIIRRKGADNALFYIHRDVLFTYLIRKLLETTESLREQYDREWTGHLKEYRRTDIMNDDQAFSRDVENRFRIEQPFLAGLMDFDLLSIARRETTCPPDLQFYVNNLFSDSKVGLKPLSEILGLRRKELLDSAKLHLSFWELMPSFRKIITFLRRIFTPKKGGRTTKAKTAGKVSAASGARAAAAYGSAAGTSGASGSAGKSVGPVPGGKPSGAGTSIRDLQARTEAYNAAILRLKDGLVGKGVSLDRKLDELAEKWNPLYDEAAKRNLVLDTNALIRDYFRSLKKGFSIKPPDIARIENLAETLAENQAFSRIRRRDVFMEYIKVYLVKLLGEK